MEAAAALVLASYHCGLLASKWNPKTEEAVRNSTCKRMSGPCRL